MPTSRRCWRTATFASTSTSARLPARNLASDFGVTGSMGLVLSDKTGDLQVLLHSGDLSAVDMTRWVKHFADPSVDRDHYDVEYQCTHEDVSVQRHGHDDQFWLRYLWLVSRQLF